MKKLSVLLILISALTMTFGIAQGEAAPIYSLNLYNGVLIQCNGNVIEGTYSPVALDTTGAVMGSFQATQYFTTSNGGGETVAGVFNSNENHRFYLALGSGDVSYVDIYLVSINNPTVRSNGLRISCDSGTINLGGSVTADGILGIDDRINRTEGDLVNVLYRRNDPTGNPGIAVYSLDENFEGIFEGFFTYEMFEPYLDTAPEENTMLGQVDRATLYALTSGQFQVVINDPYELKIYEVVFNAFPINNVIYR